MLSQEFNLEEAERATQERARIAALKEQERVERQASRLAEYAIHLAEEGRMYEWDFQPGTRFNPRKGISIKGNWGVHAAANRMLAEHGLAMEHRQVPNRSCSGLFGILYRCDMRVTTVENYDPDAFSKYSRISDPIDCF